jgi:hypothetical protein
VARGRHWRRPELRIPAPRILSVAAALLLFIASLSSTTETTLTPEDLTPAANTSAYAGSHTLVYGSWTNPTNAYGVSDTTVATTLPPQNDFNQLSLKGFNLGALPGNSTINSVVARVRWRVSTTASVATLRAQAEYNGSTSTAQNNTSEPTSLTDTDFDFTSFRSWTWSELQDPTFGILLSAVRGNSATNPTFSIDSVEVRVAYTVPPTLNQAAYRWFNGSSTPAFGTDGTVTDTTLLFADASATDGTHLWTVGRTVAPGSQWTTSKRLVSDGSLVAGYGSAGYATAAVAANMPQGMVIDATYSYVVGSNDSGDWYIEKRALSNGALDNTFGTSGVVNGAAATATAVSVAADATHLYVHGDDASGNPRVEKRLKTTGALVGGFGSSGVQTGSLGTAPTLNMAEIRIDSTHYYVGGLYGTGKIEKRLLSTGALDTGFGTSGVLDTLQTNLWTFTVVGSGLYLAVPNADSSWRFNKRLTSTGAIDTTWGSSGYTMPVDFESTQYVAVTTVESDGTSLFFVGMDSYSQWRVDQVTVSNGAYVIGEAIAAGANNIRTIAVGASHVYLQGQDGATNGRIEKRSTSSLKLARGFDLTAAAAQNTLFATAPVANLRLRVAMSVSTDNLPLSSEFKLQSALLSGSCAASTYADVSTSSGNIRFQDNTGMSSPVSLVGLDLAGDPVYSAQTNVYQYYSEANTITTRASTSPGQSAVWDLPIDAANAAPGTYCLRMVNSSGTALNTYTQYPTLNVTGSAAAFDQAAYRFFANVNGAGDAVPLAATNTPHTLASATNPVRLRPAISVSSSMADGEDFKLQFATKSGSCAASTYADVATGAGAIRYHDNAALTDKSPAAADSDDPVYNSQTNIAQLYAESGNFSLGDPVQVGESGVFDISLTPQYATAATTYCFRLVRNSGTLLDTYSAYPEFTTPAANTLPATPSSLAQFRSDGSTSLGTGSWTSEATVILTATVSDVDGNQVQLCVENVSTAFSSPASPATCGSLVNSTSTASVTVSGLSTNTQYRWQVKAKDSTGAYSTAYATFNSGSLAYGVDLDDPAAPSTIYDGSSAGVDASFNNGALDSLSANWTAVIDTGGSGLSKYEYAIGTTAGGTDIRNWTDASTATTVTASSLVLRTSQTYYVSVRVVDNAGRTGSIITSNGQLVAPTLTFSVSSPTVVLDQLHTSNSFTDTKTSVLTTSTNAYGGYVIRAYGSALTGTSGTISAFTGGTYASPDNWNPGDTGFGLTSNDTLVQGVNKYQPATCPGGSTLVAPGCYAPLTASAPGDIIADHASGVVGTSISNEAFTVTYRVTVPPTQAAGVYSNTVVFSVTATY